jgi:hypothetical protein
VREAAGLHGPLEDGSEVRELVLASGDEPPGPLFVMEGLHRHHDVRAVGLRRQLDLRHELVRRHPGHEIDE